MSAASATKRRYEAISGVRALMSLWVLTLHCTTLVAVLTMDSPSALAFTSLPWANAARHFGCQVDGKANAPLCCCVVLV